MTRFINRLAIFTVITAGMSMIFVAGVAGIWLKDRFIPSSEYETGICQRIYSNQIPHGEWVCIRKYKNENIPIEKILPFMEFRPSTPLLPLLPPVEEEAT